MKSIKLFSLLLFGLALANTSVASVKTKTLTAETVFRLAEKMQSFEEDVLRNNITKLSKGERAKLYKMAVKHLEKIKRTGNLNEAPVGLYILALFLPPVAVAIHTNLGLPTLFNFVWTCLGYVPGVIHAFIVLSR